MSKLHKVAGCDNPDRVADIIFVHGLDPLSIGTSKIAFDTWGGVSVTSEFAPKWLHEDLLKPENGSLSVGVWLLEYASAASEWLGRSMPLNDRAGDVFDTLKTARIGKKPILFVTHSMGGLLAKKLLQRGLTSEVTDWEPIAKQVRGIAFLSTPHAGADFATFIGNLSTVLRLTDSVKELESNASALRDLSVWFRNNALRSNVDVISYCEAYETRGVRVVNETSGDPNIYKKVVTSIDADHMSVAKATTRDSKPYPGILLWAQECLERKTPLPFELRLPDAATTGGRKTLPTKNAFFSGRGDELTTLHNALNNGGTAAVTQAVSGLGGIGKTALAVEYAHTYSDGYDHRLFCLADSPASLSAGFRAIASELALPLPADAKDDDITDAVKRWLETTPRTLLILDNADFGDKLTVAQLKAFLPAPPKGHVLITTRAQVLDGSLNVTRDHVLTLGVMDKDEAATFLMERVKGKGATLTGDEADAAAELAKELGYLALALEQAAAYIAQPGRTFRLYLNLYRKRLIEQVEKAKPEAGGYVKPQIDSDGKLEWVTMTVATTWQISFDEVERVHPAATELLTLSAYLAPDDIPGEVVCAATLGALPKVEAFFAGVMDADEGQERYNELLEPLTRYSLVTINTATFTYSVHRLVQAVIRHKQSHDGQVRWRQVSIDVINAAFPEPVFENLIYCERMLANVLHVMQFSEDNRYCNATMLDLTSQYGAYLALMGRYSVAQEVLEKALTMCRAKLPDNE